MASDDFSGERHRRRRRRRHGSSRGERRHREERYEAEEQSADEDSGGRRQRRRPEIRARDLALGIAAVVAFILIAGGGWYYYKSVTSPAARALAEARDLPLVGMVMTDDPDAKERLRAAIEEDLRQPNKDGPSHQAMVVSELRSEYIAPTLRRADDASLIATMTARAALIEHLNKTSTAVCREFALGGIAHPENLDADGQRLFKDVLAAVQAAYRNGRASTQSPPVPTLQQVGNMLIEAGFIKSDFDKLNSFATLSNDVSCYITLKVNQAMASLKPEERGPYARYILGN